MTTMIVLCGENCGYCKKAKMLIRRALEKTPEFTTLDIQYILEESAEGKRLSHTLVPAFYGGDKLLFEGNPAMEDVTAALAYCYKKNL